MLKSEAMKERHWKKLLRKFGVIVSEFNISEMTLTNLWEWNLLRHEKTINEVLNESR
jgi:hypothetical protein